MYIIYDHVIVKKFKLRHYFTSHHVHTSCVHYHNYIKTGLTKREALETALLEVFRQHNRGKTVDARRIVAKHSVKFVRLTHPTTGPCWSCHDATSKRWWRRKATPKQSIRRCKHKFNSWIEIKYAGLCCGTWIFVSRTCWRLFRMRKQLQWSGHSTHFRSCSHRLLLNPTSPKTTRNMEDLSREWTVSFL